MRRLAAVLILGLTACDLGYEPNVNFSHSLVETPGATDNASVQGSREAIFAAGTMLTPSACQTLSASSRTTDEVITITIKAAARSTCGVTGAGAYNYQLSVEGIDRGTYTARVVYDWGSQKPTRTIIEEPVIIN